MKLHIFKAEED